MTRKRSVKRHAVVQPLDQSIRLIPLTRGQNAMVDSADFEWLSQWNWQAQWNDCTKSFYARRWESSDRSIKNMHREILGCMGEEEGDHENHDTLNNRRLNLRRASKQENCGNQRKPSNNTSGYKGVSWHKQHKKYAAGIRIHYKRMHLGYFDTAEQAAHAYNEAALWYFGDFSLLNMVASKTAVSNKPPDKPDV